MARDRRYCVLKSYEHNEVEHNGMFKRDGRVYTQIVKNCSANELMLILSQYSKLDSSTIYSDCWKAYDGLVDYGAKAHYRVKHSKNEF